jgi:hypothetical protein
MSSTQTLAQIKANYIALMGPQAGEAFAELMQDAARVHLNGTSSLHSSPSARSDRHAEQGRSGLASFVIASNLLLSRAFPVAARTGRESPIGVQMPASSLPWSSVRSQPASISVAGGWRYRTPLTFWSRGRITVLA